MSDFFIIAWVLWLSLGIGVTFGIISAEARAAREGWKKQAREPVTSVEVFLGAVLCVILWPYVLSWYASGG